MRRPQPEGQTLLLVPRPALSAAPSPGQSSRAGRSRAAELLAVAREDAHLAERLLEFPASERMERVLRDPRFQRQTLADLFSLRAENDLYDSSGDPLESAELAAAIATSLPSDPAGKARKTEAIACWLLGKALLRRRDWRRAEHAFIRGQGLLLSRESSEEQALGLTGLAQLNEDLGQPDAAAALFLQAAYSFAQRGAADPAAACQAQLGLLQLEIGDLVSARSALRVAVRLLDRTLAPSLAARMLLALSQIEATLGNPASASEYLRQAQDLYGLNTAHAEGIVRTWWEARIEAADGQYDYAEPLFDHVRLELLARGSLAEAARSTFDHLLLRIIAGRSDTVEELTAALLHAFPEAAAFRVAEMARIAQMALMAGDQIEGRYGKTFDLRRRASLPAPGRSDLLVSSRTLADRLLRRRGEHEDPLGDAPR